MLLGLDHSHLIAVLESRVGRDDDPFASRTRLGWIVRGLLGGDIVPMTALSYHLTATSREESLFKNHWMPNSEPFVKPKILERSFEVKVCRSQSRRPRKS